MRVLTLAAVCISLLALAPASEAATPVRGAAPAHLHGFLLRADEPVEDSFSRTPSFAWNPVAGAVRYQFQLATSSTFRDSGLVFTVRDCETTTADEPAEDAIAFVEIEAQMPSSARATPSLRQVFKGWMFADSPSVNPMQHPVYDAWLIACKA